MKRFILLIFFLFMQQIVVAEEVIRYEGSSTIGSFLASIDEHYKPARFVIKTASESLGGERCASRQRCDLGGVARRVHPRYVKKGLYKTLMGKDAIALIINKANPVENLNASQLRDIFTNQTKNWSTVGGQNLSIHPLIPRSTSAARQVFSQKVLDGEKYRGTKVVTPNRRILSVVANDKRAIGLVSFSLLNSKVKKIRVNGQTVTTENTNYPLTRPLYLVTQDRPKGKVKAFLNWLTSKEGQKLVKRQFIGVN